MSLREALRNRTRQAWTWWWTTVDTGGVLCQTALYPFLWLSGVYMTFTDAPTTVRGELGGGAHWVWIGLLTLCPITCLAGQLLHDQYTGRQLQLWSNIGITCALGAYVSAVVQASWLGRGLFAVYMAAGFTILAAVISIRDVRKLRAIRAHAKES
ncbi:hypothetical protein [Gordonia soli]|uniref:Uncharacterized protein n=1 Tax=Gordonia soli NBRC 108243 TaxID=1223545 RepID=M0QRP1_9ACTN|nr:hypothetical protein [Gordonia soli]GAC71041.1 hypothetical protein GS4_47_00310 [Gordonia soli NBRC 108243]